MAQSIDELSISIKASSDKASDSIRKLVGNIKELSDAIAGISTTNLTNLTNTLNSLAIGMSHITSNKDAVRTIKDLSKAINNIPNSASSLDGLASGMANLNREAQSAMNTFASATEYFQSMGSNVTNFDPKSNGLVACQTTVERIKDEMVLVNEAMLGFTTSFNGSNKDVVIDVDFHEVEEANHEMQRLLLTQKDLAEQSGVVADAFSSEEIGESFKFKNVDEKHATDSIEKYKTALSALKAVADRTRSALTKLGSAIGNVFKKSSGMSNGVDAIQKKLNKVVKSMTRILKMLRLMVLRKILQAIIKNAIEGFNHMVQYSDKFNASVSLLWNSLKQLGNALGAMVAPLVNVFAPAINMIIQYLIEAVNKVNQLFSALAGSSTWTKARLLTEDYRESIDKTTTSAKKLNKQLQSFDALNNLTTQDKEGLDPKKMFEEKEVEERFKRLAKSLKDQFDLGDFFKTGLNIGQALKKALDKINWDGIRRKAKKIGTAIATLINGFVNVSGLAKSIGTTLSEALNTAFEFLNGFVHRLEWDKIGKFIAETFNGFFEGVDWDLILDTFVTGFEGLADAINSFIDTFHWSNVSESISRTVNTLSTAIYTFFKRVKWEKLGSRIGQQVRDAIRKIDWRMLGRTIGSIIQSAINFVKSIIKELKFKDIVKALHDFFKGVFEELNISDVVMLFLVGLGGIMASLLPKAIKAVALGKGLKKVIQNAMGIASDSIDLSKMSSIAKPIIGISSVVGEIVLVKDALSDLVTGAKNVQFAFAEIATGVGTAVLACTMAFGFPMGTVIALIGGVVGAIYGINEAFSEIDAQKASESIRRALTSEDGTPIEDAFAQSAENIRKMSDSMGELITNASASENTTKQIGSVIESINSIKTAMDQSVIDVTSAREQLEEQFTLLANAVSQKFDEVNTVLMGAFSKDGAIGQALENLGVDVEQAQVEITGITVEGQKRIEEIKKEIADIFANATYDEDGVMQGFDVARLTELQDELLKLSGKTDEATQKMQEYKNEIVDLTNIDYSKLVADDGTLDTGKLASALDNISNAMSDAYENTKESTDLLRTTLQEAIDGANSIGDKVKAEELTKALNALPEAIVALNSDISTEGLKVANTMQEDLVGKMDDVIADAKERWENMSWWERKMTHVADEDMYVSKAISDYIGNVLDPVSEQIEEQFGQLGIKGAGWASDASHEILRNLLVVKKDGWSVSAEISDDYSEIIKSALDNAKKQVDEDTKGLGKAISDGVDAGFDANKIVKAVGDGCQKAIDEYAKVQDSHSPSKVYESLSKDSVDGLILGWKKHANDVVTAVKEVAESIIGAFAEANTKEAWAETLQNIKPAFQDAMTGAVDALKDVWSDFADWINKHLEFKVDTGNEIGKGIAEALGSDKITLGKIPAFATGGFPSAGLFMANENGIEAMGRMGNRNVVANNEQIVDGIAKGVASANSEQNTLLRQQNELLRGILEKETGITSDQLFRSVQSSANSYYQRTGRYAFT